MEKNETRWMVTYPRFNDKELSERTDVFYTAEAAIEFVNALIKTGFNNVSVRKIEN